MRPPRLLYQYTPLEHHFRAFRCPSCGFFQAAGFFIRWIDAFGTEVVCDRRGGPLDGDCRRMLEQVARLELL